MAKLTRKERLIRFVSNPSPAVFKKVLELKKLGQKQRKRPDLIWHLLLTGLSTLGNSRGYEGLLSDPKNYNALAYDSLKSLRPSGRRIKIEKILRRSKVRMPVKKAEWLSENVEIIKGMGGLECAKHKAFAQKGREAKIIFMKRFKGIGDKYARNLWMDIYHPEFRSTIAVDERIKNVSKALGKTFKTYVDHERFYQDLASESGREPWELDRILYWFQDSVLNILGIEKERRRSSANNSLNRTTKSCRF